MKYNTNNNVVKLQMGKSIPNKRTQKIFDNVASKILQNDSTKNRNISSTTGIRYEQPLKDIHPELDLALMYAQPGSFVAKVFAPFMAKSTLNSIKNRNVLEAFSPGIKSTIGAEILGLPKGVRRNLSLNDLQLKSIVGKGDEATVFNTGLSKRYVIKIERPGRPVIGGHDYVRKSLDIPTIAGENGARTYYVGKIGDKNVLLQERVYPFTKEKSFEKLTNDSGLILDRELHDAYNPQKRWGWIDARPSNSGIGIDGKLKIIDGVVDTFKQGGILKGQNGIPSIENVPSQTDNTSVKTTNPYKQQPIDYISEYFNYDVAPRYLRENPNATQQETDAIKNINANTKQVVRNKLTNPNYAGETYVNTTSRFLGIPWRKNPSINYSPILYNEGVQAHELTHAYRQGVLGKYIGEVNDKFGIPGFYGLKQRTGYNGVESNYLNNAYDSNGLLDQQRKWVEKGATNSELRYILWKKLYDELGRRPSLQETDDYIRNYNDENLLNELYDLGSSYSNRYYMNHLYNYPDYTPKEDTNTSNIKDALIHVASNDKKLDMTNLAKNGIKI